MDAALIVILIDMNEVWRSIMRASVTLSMTPVIPAVIMKLLNLGHRWFRLRHNIVLIALFRYGQELIFTHIDMGYIENCFYDN